MAGARAACFGYECCCWQEGRPQNGVALAGVESLSQPRSNAGSNPVGTWLSLVEHSLGVRGVGSSNLPVPTK